MGVWTATAACHALDYFEDMPCTLLHGDAHPWNAICSDDGAVTLIDWDSAGLGPSIVDLGFLLLSAYGGGIDKPAVNWDASRVRAVARGYAAVRTPEAAELSRLAAAIRFRPLVGAVGCFVDAMGVGAA